MKHRNLLDERKGMTRGLPILLARLTARQHKRIFSLCHYFAIMKPVRENESRHLGQNEMAGLKGKSGPPGNMNAFKHGLASIQKRREEGVPTEYEESVRQQILDGLIADKGGDEQVSTATRFFWRKLSPWMPLGSDGTKDVRSCRAKAGGGVSVGAVSRAVSRVRPYATVCALRSVPGSLGPTL